MKLPTRLTEDEHLHVFWPAGPTQEDALERGLQVLASWPWPTRICRPGPSSSPPWLAARDAERATAMVSGLEDVQTGALLAARGGYGCMRLLDALPSMPCLREGASPPWLVGFSDVTALHAWAYTQGVISIHGPVVTSLGHPHTTHAERHALRQILAGGPPPMIPLGKSFPGSVTAPLLGGNLCLLAALRGTPWQLPEHPYLLLVEEVGESPYRVDRTLRTLLLHQGLRHCKAVIFGHLTACGDDPGGLLDHLASDLRAAGIPSLRGAPVGHQAPNLPFLHGATYRLEGQHLRCVHPGAATPQAYAVAGPPPTDRVQEVVHWIDEALEQNLGSAIALEMHTNGECALSVMRGHTALPGQGASVPLRADHAFDLASLTKPLCTSLLAGVAVETGRLTWESRLPASLHASEPTLHALLTHSSGLPAHLPFFEAVRAAQPADGSAPEQMRALLGAAEVDPKGVYSYSDVGFMLLGLWLEEVLQAPLDQAFSHHIAPFAPELHFLCAPSPHPEDYVATEWCPWRGRMLQGWVHDENAQAMGGVAGHAGLFGTARAVASLSQALLAHPPMLLGSALLETLWDPRHRAPGGSHVRGWDTPSGTQSSAGDHLDRARGVGHLGFTGTSVWLDPASRLSVVLLTNRVHPSREDTRIRALRHRIHTRLLGP